MPVKTATKADPNAELVISLEGKILESNFDEFCTQLKARIESLNTELKTDSDFEQANTNAKFLKQAENSLKEAKERALQQAEEVQKLFAAIDDVSETARESRLKLEKQIQARKTQRRKEIIDDAVASLDVLKKSHYQGRIEESLKGRSNFERMEWAADNEAKEIQKEVDATRKVIAAHRNAHGELLLHDTADLEIKKAEDVAVELERRLERKRADDEARRLREEKDKAEREAKAQREREAAAMAKAEAEARAVEKASAPGAPATTPENHIPPYNERGAAAQPQAQNTAPTGGARPGQAATVGRANAEVSEAQELHLFKQTLLSALAPVKEARTQLRHGRNIRKASVFAQALNEAYKALSSTEGGAQ